MKDKTTTSTHDTSQSLIHNKKLTQASLFTLHHNRPGAPYKCQHSHRRRSPQFGWDLLAWIPIGNTVIYIVALVLKHECLRNVAMLYLAEFNNLWRQLHYVSKGRHMWWCKVGSPGYWISSYCEECLWVYVWDSFTGTCPQCWWLLIVLEYLHYILFYWFWVCKAECNRKRPRRKVQIRWL